MTHKNTNNSLKLSELDLDLPLARRVLKQLAVDCAKEILDNFGGLVPQELKGDGSPVSKVDLRNNQRVVESIALNFPKHSVIGEEGDLKQQSDFAWVCDPVDGTCPFVLGIPTSVFSLALVYKGRPILACLVDPYNGGRSYWAELGAGTTLNGKPVRVNSKADFDLANIALDDSQLSVNRFDVNVREDLQQARAYCWQYFSIAYSATRVAVGAFSAAIFSGDKPWDIAAAKLIVEEAGGLVTDFQGNDQAYDRLLNGAILSNAYMHEALVKLLAGRIYPR